MTTQTTTQTETPKIRIITLTGRAPIKIREDHWPIVASANGDSYRGPRGDHHIAVAREEVDRYLLRVRQHTDGRIIVYARLDGSHWTGTDDRRRGILLPAGSDIVAAIRRVGEDCHIPDDLIHECIADLPAEEI